MPQGEDKREVLILNMAQKKVEFQVIDKPKGLSERCPCDKVRGMVQGEVTSIRARRARQTGESQIRLDYGRGLPRIPLLAKAECMEAAGGMRSILYTHDDTSFWTTQPFDCPRIRSLVY